MQHVTCWFCCWWGARHFYVWMWVFECCAQYQKEFQCHCLDLSNDSSLYLIRCCLRQKKGLGAFHDSLWNISSWDDKFYGYFFIETFLENPFLCWNALYVWVPSSYLYLFYGRHLRVLRLFPVIPFKGWRVAITYHDSLSRRGLNKQRERNCYLRPHKTPLKHRRRKWNGGHKWI